MAKNTKKQNSKPSEVENKFQLLLTLITLLKSARHKSKKTELEFLMVNQTFNLVQYSNCAYWEYKKRKTTIKNISGLVQIDPDGPYTQWLTRVINHYVSEHEKNSSEPDETNAEEKDEAPKEAPSFSKLHQITIDDCQKDEADDWNKWVSDNAYIIIMRNMYDDVIGGLWLDRNEDFGTLQKALIEDLGDGYAHALQKFDGKNKGRHNTGLFSIFDIPGLKTKLFFLALSLIMFIPVKMSATAPAEIIASKPDSINIPFDGVIDSVEVSPGQEVKAGDVLIRMDSTLLENKVTMTMGELTAAEIALRKTERESMKDRKKLAEIAVLKSRLAQKTAEVKFAREMLELAVIIADRDGIAIFADTNALTGKPVQTGEQVMQLANLNDSELMIRMPVSSMIKIDQDVPTKFFLNVNPFDSQQATYENIGYQATMDGGGLMTYKIRGRFIDQDQNLRIGWTGTGKVYGERTILAVNLLRRPITTLRRKLGI